MKYDELLNKVETLIPGASVELDNGGQIVIYTGMREGPRTGQIRGEVELVTFELDDE